MLLVNHDPWMTLHSLIAFPACHLFTAFRKPLLNSYYVAGISETPERAKQGQESLALLELHDSSFISFNPHIPCKRDHFLPVASGWQSAQPLWTLLWALFRWRKADVEDVISWHFPNATLTGIWNPDLLCQEHCLFLTKGLLCHPVVQCLYHRILSPFWNFPLTTGSHLSTKWRYRHRLLCPSCSSTPLPVPVCAFPSPGAWSISHSQGPGHSGSFQNGDEW